MRWNTTIVSEWEWRSTGIGRAGGRVWKRPGIFPASGRRRTDSLKHWNNQIDEKPQRRINAKNPNPRHTQPERCERSGAAERWRCVPHYRVSYCVLCVCRYGVSFIYGARFVHESRWSNDSLDRISVITGARPCVWERESILLFREVWISAVVYSVSMLICIVGAVECVTCLFCCLCSCSCFENRGRVNLSLVHIKLARFQPQQQNPSSISVIYRHLCVLWESCVWKQLFSLSLWSYNTHSNCSSVRFFRGFVFGSLLCVWFTLKNKGSSLILMVPRIPFKIVSLH